MQKGPAHLGEQDLFYYTKFNQHQLVHGQIFVENSGFFMKM